METVCAYLHEDVGGDRSTKAVPGYESLQDGIKARVGGLSLDFDIQAALTIIAWRNSKLDGDACILKLKYLHLSDARLNDAHWPVGLAGQGRTSRCSSRTHTWRAPI